MAAMLTGGKPSLGCEMQWNAVLWFTRQVITVAVWKNTISAVFKKVLDSMINKRFLSTGQNNIRCNCHWEVGHLLGWRFSYNWTAYTRLHYTHNPLTPKDLQHQHNSVVIHLKEQNKILLTVSIKDHLDGLDSSNSVASSCWANNFGREMGY